MENKYYTPTLEEFHVGFELELYGSIGHVGLPRKNSVPGWYPSKINTTEDYCMYTSFPIETIRVKYLDKEDIESLGFTYDDCFRDGGTSVFYSHDEMIGLHFYGTNNIVENKLRIRLLRYNGNPIYQGCIFDGTIKNKSGLVNLLKQLGIK